MLPMVLPPAIQALMHSPPAGTPEQQVHQAAAAAAAAAAVMSSPYSTYSTMMLPPSIIPMGEPPANVNPAKTYATQAFSTRKAIPAYSHRKGCCSCQSDTKEPLTSLPCRPPCQASTPDRMSAGMRNEL